MKLNIFFLILAVAMCSAACENARSPFVDKNAQFVGYNNSRDHGLVYVNDGTGFPVAANSTTRFVVEVPIPKNPIQPGYFGTPTGPSSVDKIVRVSVAFKNLTTGKLLPPIFCDAGAKLVTTVWYEVSSYGYESLRCQSSY